LLDELTLVVWGFAAELSDYVPQPYAQQLKTLSSGTFLPAKVDANAATDASTKIRFLPTGVERRDSLTGKAT
jgi:hypothetical protein